MNIAASFGDVGKRTSNLEIVFGLFSSLLKRARIYPKSTKRYSDENSGPEKRLIPFLPVAFTK